MGVKTARRELLLATLALVAVAAPARAANVSVVEHDPFAPGCCQSPTYEVVFRGAPGEVNQVTASHDSSGAIAIRDAGAELTVSGQGCQAVDAHKAACQLEADLTIRTGDQGDRVTLTGPGTVHGGPGDDVLAGGEGDQILVGGPGRDILSGGPGDDMLRDGNRPRPRGGADADHFDGGPGIDTLTYASRLSPVRIDLAAGNAGATGEGDRVVNVENAIGGHDDDVLIGDAGPNTLDGGPGPGSDTLRGRAGDDRLFGGDGEDRLSGGPGQDGLYGGGPTEAVDRFSCGADLDYSSQLDEHDLVSEDCESVILGYGDYVAQDLPPTSLDAPILYDDSRGCADYCPDARAVYIREARFSQFAVGAHPGRLLARASFPAGPFPPRSRPVRLSKEGKAEVRRLGVLRVEVTAGDSRYLTILRAP